MAEIRNLHDHRTEVRSRELSPILNPKREEVTPLKYAGDDLPPVDAPAPARLPYAGPSGPEHVVIEAPFDARATAGPRVSQTPAEDPLAEARKKRDVRNRSLKPSTSAFVR